SSPSFFHTLRRPLRPTPSPYTTLFRSTLLLPRAAGGLATGTLLGLARAAGETAPIMFTAAIFSGATLPRGIADSPVLALPYHIRSEEHTSELQSLAYLVCRLLPETKKS